MSKSLSFILLAAFLLTGCSAPQAASGSGEYFIIITADPNATQTPTPFQPGGFVPSERNAAGMTPAAQPGDLTQPTSFPSPLPTLAATETPTLPPPTLVPSPTSAAPPSSTPVTPTARPQYLLFAVMDYTRKRISVDELIAYTNHTGETLGSLVLAVDPNMYTDCFALKSVTVGGVNASYTLQGIEMDVTLPEPLAPEQAVQIAITYNLNLPLRGTWDIFGYTGDQINLTDWYPFVVPYVPGGGWLIHKQWPFGEHLVYDESDFEVNLKQADPGLGVSVAASGSGEANGDWTRYRLQNARTFALSASTQFLVYASSVGGIPVTSYYFAGSADGGVDVASYVGQAIDLYSALYAPFPYPGMSVVETAYADGMEFDGLIFLSRNFYSGYNGSAQSNLCSLGVHETAHQWWFGMVGSDQALEPWIDEALAVYSERLFYENNYPGLVNWWWQFRVNYFDPSGYVDTDIYHGTNFRTYVNAVYLNGANFLEDLRTRIGDASFLAFLKDYAAQMAGRRATKRDFFNILYQHATVDYSDIVAEYFQNP
jgi:hypothetical protein